MALDWNPKTGIIPFPKKLPPVEPGVEDKIYCCKKWVAGELKRFYSSSPCSLGSVQCSDADPPKPGNGGVPTCEENCQEMYGQERGEYGRRGPGRQERQLQRCLDNCRKKDGNGDGNGEEECEDGFHWNKALKKCVKDMTECPTGYHVNPKTGRCVPDECPTGFKRDPKTHKCIPDDGCDPGWHKDPNTGECVKDSGGDGPCPGSGYEREFGKSLCDEGYSGKKDPETGNWWCCKDEEPPPPDPDNPCEEGGSKLTGESCEEGETEVVNEKGDTWCCPDGNGNGGPGGEFKWGEGLQGLLARIMERANYLLDYPRGLTPQERQSVINYAIEGVKAGEAGEKQTRIDELSRIGMFGSGFQEKEMARISRETRQEAGDVRRELGIDELDRRFQEIMGTTGMAQSLTGTLMEGEKIPEILSGARRQEGQGGINSLIALLTGSGGGDSAYWQAIISQAMGGGGGDMSWLYYLPYIFGQNQITSRG